MEVLNPKTNRFVKVGSQGYKRLVRDGTIKPAEAQPTLPVPAEAATPPEESFDDSKLQSKLAEISTDMIKENMKTIVKSQKLSDQEMDVMLKRMLYKKLCLEPPKKVKPVKKSKKSKFKIVSSESETESD